MKPDRDPGLTVESTVRGEEVKMGIAQNALTHIMGILTDMYPVPVIAVIREYATNAWDSHVAAGNTNTPIEVSLPTALNPVYQVRDFGVGLDADDIRGLYSQYGASTKRDSDDVQGMLGIGSKSALAHTDQFTFTGIKNGIKTVASVSRDEDGVATMMIVSETPTDEPTGVLVSVPANGKETEFEEYARDFFKFWDPETVRIDEQPPQPVEGYALSEHMIIEDWTDPDPYGYGRRRRREGKTSRHIIVMGNVPYPIPESEGDKFEQLKIPANRRLVTWVPIGTVHFTPARDSLQDTARTKRALERIREDYKNLQRSSLQKNLDGTKDRRKVLEILLEASKTFPAQDYTGLTWQGKPLPMTDMGKSRTTAPTYRAKYALSMEEDTNMLDIARAPVVLSNFTNDTWSGPMLSKLKAYVEAKGKRLDWSGGSWSSVGTQIVMFRGQPKHPEWVPFLVDWKDVRKWQPPGGQAAKGGSMKKILGSYEVKKKDDWRGEEMLGADILKEQKAGKVVVWTSGGKYARTGHMDQLWAQYSDALVVTLTENRIAKFERDFPSVPKITDELGKKHLAWWHGLKPLQRAALKSRFPGDMLSAAKLKNVRDPLLSKAIKLWKAHEPLRRSYHQATRFLGDDKLGKADGRSLQWSEVKTLERRYPLLFGTRATNDHMQWYVDNVPRKEG